MPADPEDHRLSQARALGRLGRHEAALSLLPNGLSGEHVSPDLLVERAHLLRSTGALAQAETVVAALAGRWPDHPGLAELRGEMATATGDLTAAERIYHAEHHARPHDAKRRARWAHSLMRLGRYDEAAVVLDAALLAGQRTAALLVAKVDLLIAAGRPDEAKEVLDQLCSLHPGHDRVAPLRAKLAEANGDREAAERIQAADVSAHPDDVSRRLRWLKALKRLGRNREALEAAVAGLELAPDAAALLAERAVLHVSLGQVPDAQAAVAALAAHDPGHPRLTILRARLADLSGDPDAAERAWAEHVAAHPHDIHARLRWARSLVRLDHRGDALTVLDQGLARSPDHPGLVAARIPLLTAAGQVELAEAALLTLAAHSPDHPRLGPMRAELAAATGDLETAERLVAEMAAQAPGDAAHSLGWARRLAGLGRIEEALAALAQGLETAPDGSALLVEQARWLIESGRSEAAEQAIAILAERQPEHPRLASLRAHLAETAGDLDTAADLYAGDAATFPNDVERRVRWLRHLLHTGRIAEALAILDERPSLHAQERHVRLDCLLEAGRWDAAAALLAAWPQDGPMRDQLVQRRGLMDLAQMRCDFAAALGHAQEALGLAPHDHGAAQGLARAAMGLFRTELAWRALDRVRIRGVTGGGPPRRGVGRLRHLVGQIVNEYRLRPDETEALAAAAATGDAALIPLAAAQLRADPGSFGAAIGVLTGLARTGRLGSPDRTEGPASEAIPAVLHQFWDTPAAPPDVERLMAHARTLNPGCEHRRWSDVEARRFLSGLNLPHVLAAYRRSRHPAQRADILRLAVLYELGGLYLDADDHCARPLHSLIPAGAALVCYQENIGSIGNNFLAARARHPIIGAALTAMTDAVVAGASETLWLVTGPGLLTRIVAHAIAQQPECALPAGLHVVSLDVFRSTVHTRRKASYKADARSWKRVG